MERAAFASRGAISSSLNLVLRFLRRRREDAEERNRSGGSAWDDRIGTIALQVFARSLEWDYFSSSGFLYPGWYRFHRECGITAINYEGGRPKGNVVVREEGGGGRERERERRERTSVRKSGARERKTTGAARFAHNFHVVVGRGGGIFARK